MEMTVRIRSGQCAVINSQSMLCWSNNQTAGHQPSAHEQPSTPRLRFDSDAAAAVNQAMTLALQAATRAHPAGFTITGVSHDSQLLSNPRTVEPTFYAASTGATPTTV